MTTKFKTTMLNWSKFVGTIILFHTLFLSSAFAQTGPIFTYHGRLVDSTTNTAVNGTVNFLIQIQSTNNCLMYEEVQTKALSQGVFALNINSGVGTTTYGQTQSGYSFQSIMSNTNTLNLSYATYSSAAITPAHPLPPVGSCTFTPSPARTDSRKLVVYFFNPSDVTMVSWEPLPVQTIGYVPMAVEALNVGGFPSASLLRFVDGSGNPLATTPLSNANYTELMALLTGTSTTFLRATDPAVGFTGALTGDVTGTQAATVVSSLRGTAVSATPPIAGQYMVYNGTAWEATNGSGGTVTNVSSGNGYVTVTNPTTTPVVTVNVGTIANTVAAGNDSRIVGAIQTGSAAGGDLAGTYPNPTVSAVGGRTSAQINTSVGDTIAATATNTASTIVKRDASGNVAVSTASANNFSGRNYLFYNTGNTFATTITAPAGLAANLNLVLPANNGTPGYVLITDGAGNTSWANPSTGNVTSVTALAPVVSSGGQTPQISMAAATDAVPGYLTAADHNTFNNLRQSTTLPTGQVWVGSAGNLAAAKLLNISDIKSSAVGNPNFLNAAGACASGQSLSYSAVTDTLVCQAYAITSAQVASALGAAPAGTFVIGGGAGNTVQVQTMSGDTAVNAAGAVTIQPGAVDNGKIADGSINNVKINDVAWGKITGHPTTIAGYGITDAVLTNAGGITDMQAGPIASRPAAASANQRYYISTDTQETWFSTAGAWVKIGSAVGLGGTVTSITAGTGLTGGTITSSGTINLANTAVTPAAYGSASLVPTFTVDAQGRLTAAGSVAYQDAGTTGTKGIVDVGSNLTVTAGTLSLTNANVVGALGFTPSNAALPTNQIFVGNGSGIAAPVALSGDATIVSSGALTLANSGATAGTYSKVTVDAKGRVTVGAQLNTADIATALGAAPTGSFLIGNAGTATITAMTGDTNVSATGIVTIQPNAVTNAKINDVAWGKVTGTPTTIAGYGITNAVNKTGDTMSGALNMGANDITNTGNINMAANRTLLVSNFATDPLVGSFTAADVGRVWYNTTSNQLKYYNGSGIQIVASASGAVTNVTASAPLVSSGGLTPNITINDATTLAKGAVQVGTDLNVAAGVVSVNSGTAGGAGDANKIAKLNASGQITTAMLPSTVVTSTTLTGDVSGTMTANTVDKIKGTDVTITALTSGNFLRYNGAAWVNAVLGLSDIPNMDAAHMPAFTGDVTTTAGTTATTIANNAVTTAKINNLAVTDAKISDVAWSKVTGRATTVAGYGITDAVSNVGVGAGNVVTSMQSGNTAGRPVAGTDGRIYIDTQAGIIYRDNGASWVNVGSATGSGGTVTNVTGTAPISVATGTTTPVISLNNTAVTPGTYGSATAVPSFTVDAQGRLTLAGSSAYATATGASLGIVQTGANITNTAGVISLTGTNVTNALGFTPATSVLTSGNIFVGNATNVATGVAMTGDATISNTGALTLTNTGTAGTYGTSTSVPAITTDAQGRVTAVTVNAIPTANTTTTGLLTSADWNTFSGKQNALGFTPVNRAGDTMTGNLILSANTSLGLGQLTPAQETTLTGSLVAADKGRTWFNTTTNKMMYWDGTAAQVLSAASGSVTSVSSANGDITVGGTATTPILTLNSGVGANQIVKLDGTSRLPAVSGALVTNLDAGNITAGTLPVARGGTGAVTANAALNNLLPTQATHANRFLQTDGTNTSWVAGNVGTVTNVTGTAPISVATGTSTPVISMTAATGAVDGYLTAANFTLFNSKQPAGNYITALTGDVTAAGPGSSAATIANNAITTAKIAAGAVDNSKISDVAWTKVTATPTTLTGYGITDAVRNVGVGAGNVVTSMQSGNTAGRPAFGTDGRIYIDTQAGIIYRDNGTAWVNVGSATGSGGTVTNIATGTGLTGGPITGTGTISLANTAVTPGTYGSATAVPSFTVDAQGRLTLAGSSAYATATGASLGIVQIGANITNTAGTISISNANVIAALGAAPTGSFLFGNAGTATIGTMSGDATVGATGAVTLANTAAARTNIGLGTAASPTFTGLTVSGLTDGVVKSTSGVLSGGNSVSLTADVSGVLPVANGGTGAATLPAGSLLVGNTTGAVNALAAGTTGNVIYATGATTWASGTPNAAGLVDLATAQTISGAKTFGGHVAMSNNSRELRFPGSAANYVGFKGPAGAPASNVIWELPAADGTAGQVLRTSGTGVLSWVSAASGSVTNVTGTAPISVATGTSTPVISMTTATTAQDGYLTSTDWNTFNNKLGTSTTFAGDVTGTSSTTSVDRIKGTAVTITGLATGNFLRYNGTAWVNTMLGLSDIPNMDAAHMPAFTGDVTTTAGTTATTIANNAITTAKIAAGAVDNSKISDVAWTKVTATPTTLTGYGITDAVRNVGVGAGNVVTSMQSGNTAGRPAFGTDGRIYIDTQAGIIYRDNGTAWVNVGSANGSGGTVTNVTGTAPISVATGTTTPVISLNNTAVTPGTYGSATAVPSFTVDAQGRLTLAGSSAYATATGASLGIVQTGANITNAAGVISVATANTTTTGVITSADWNTFNSKQAGSAELTGLAALSTNGFVKRTGAGAYTTSTAIDLATADITGILPVANGGTGATTLPAGSLLVGNTTGAVNSLAAGTTGNVIYATSATAWASGNPNAAGLVDLTSTQTVSGAKTFTAASTTFDGNIVMNSNAREIRFPGSGANYVGFRGPTGAVGANRIWELPAADGTVGQVLTTSGAGVLSWSSPAAGTVWSVTSSNADIGVGGTANDPILTLNSGTGANQIVKLDGTSRLPAVDGSQLTNLDTASITTGILPVARGGTGAGTLTSNGVLLGNGTTAVTATAAGANNSVLRVPAGGGAPVFGAIDISQAAAVTGTLAVANGGTGVATIPTGSIVVGAGTGAVTNLAGGTTGNMMYATSATTWASGTKDTIGVVARGGNSFGAATMIGTNDAFAFSLESNGQTRLSFDAASAANVTNGSATATISGSAQVNGQAWSTVQTSTAATPLAWDTNRGNTMRWTTAGTGLTANITNLKPGASYMLVIKGAGTDQVTITCNGGALPPLFVPANAARVGGTANSKSVYTILNDGENCLITWITGF